jgi:hypothetical protein
MKILRKAFIIFLASSLVSLLLLLSACGGGDWKEGTCEDPEFVGPCKEETLSVKTPVTPPKDQRK